MRFQFYFPVLMVALASAVFSVGAMFGLGVMSPPKQQPQQTELKLSSKPKVVHSQADQRALTPIYPAAPGGALAEDETKSKDAPVPAAKGAATDGKAADAQTKNDDYRPSSDEKTGTLAAAAAAKPPANAPSPPQASSSPKGVQPVANETDSKTTAPTDNTSPQRAASIRPAVEKQTAHSANGCNMQACSAAYKSFRAFDCTYQPYDGPRRICVNPPVAGERQAASHPDKDAKHDKRSAASLPRDHLDGVVRAVTRQPLQPDDADEDRTDGRAVYEMAPPGGRGVIVVEPASDEEDQ